MNGVASRDAAPVRFGIDPWGRFLVHDFARVSAHALITGVTRSGKSSLAYGMLSQLAAYPHVRVVGCDPSSLLLAPFRARGEGLISLGDDVADHVRVLEGCVSVMQTRLDDLLTRGDADKLTCFDVDRPLMVVVVEEQIMLMELIRASDALSSPKGRNEMLMRSLLLRLLTGGAKCGIRVILSLQRPDAQIMGGPSRSQIETRFLLRSDGEGIRMTMPELDDGQRSLLSTAPAGVGYYTAPGVGPLLFRGPGMDYRRYAGSIRNGPSL